MSARQEWRLLVSSSREGAPWVGTSEPVGSAAQLYSGVDPATSGGDLGQRRYGGINRIQMTGVLANEAYVGLIPPEHRNV